MESPEPSQPPATIVCVDCGGEAHLLNPSENVEPGDVLVYRCVDCLDRWDVVYEPD